MDSTDAKVDYIWKRVYDKDPGLMKDWLQCFSSNYNESKQKSKEEVKMTLTQADWQTDPRKNFLWRLMSREPQKYGYVDRKYGVRKRRVDLAMLFLQVMTEQSYCEDFIVTTLDPRHSEIHPSSPVTENNLGDTQPITELCKAARLENVEKVRELTRIKGIVQISMQGYTPLHFAAMAIHPKHEIAKLLIDSVDSGERNQFLNKQTNDELGRNTALHIAAANVNVTDEFIQEFREADLELLLKLNSKGDTPFHAAAKSINPHAIIAMLNTFEPTNRSWDVDVVDAKQNYRNKLIMICARRGNAKAVALLIKHGADISQGVLHEIVLESVRNPKKIDDLVGVYESIIDNAVTWRCLEEKREFLKVKGSEDYAELFQKTVLWLLTKPVKDYNEQDVIQCALTHGAFQMLWQIVNTESVFRMQGKAISKYVDKENGDEVKNRRDNDSQSKQKHWTVFDVTNFTKYTLVKLPSVSASVTEYATNSSEKTPLNSGRPQDEANVHTLEGSAEPHHAQNSRNNKPKHDFDALPTPEKPYLTHLLTQFDQWKSTNILSTQPWRELTKPYVKLMQGCYFMLGLLQLLFMISFTVYFMPTTCSLALMFNISGTGCSNSNSSYSAMPSSVSRHRSWIAWLWLIWPCILMVLNVFVTLHYASHAYIAHSYLPHKMVVISKDLRLPVVRKVWGVLLRTIPSTVFCCIIFVWLYRYFWAESHELYVQVTAMVFLFGWIANLEFFGAVSKNFTISRLVIEKIISKDIPSFMLFFGFSVVGFSFAMHTIRMSACMPSQIIHLHDTFFAVLSSAFGIGDFFEATITDPACTGGDAFTQTLFEFVYLAYVCATMIVLLNILIAMMNSRYEKAKRKAENIYRFQILSTMMALERYKRIAMIMDIIPIRRPVDRSFGCCAGCRYGNKYRGLLSFNKRLNRHYLRLLLPVDKQLEKL